MGTAAAPRAESGRGKIFTSATLALALLASLVAFAPQVSAHHAAGASAVACDDTTGEWVVTWTVTQPDYDWADGKTMFIQSNRADLLFYPAEVVGRNQSSTVTERFDTPGQKVLDVTVSWVGQVPVEHRITADIVGDCAVRPTTGDLTVRKVVTGVGRDGAEVTASFSASVTGPDGFATVVALRHPDYTATLSDLEPGEYSVVESAPSVAPVETTYSPADAFLVEAGDSPTVTITNKYYDGPAVSATLATSCGLGITGVLRNDGDVEATFEVTSTVVADDGTLSTLTQAVVLEAGRSVSAPVAPDALQVVVSSAGVELVTSDHDPGSCFAPGTPTFALACDLNGSKVIVALDDQGTFPSDYELFVNGAPYGPVRSGDFIERIAVDEGAQYTVEVRSGGAVVGVAETFDVRCFRPDARVTPFCAVDGSGVTVALTDSGELDSEFFVHLTVAGEPTVVDGPFTTTDMPRYVIAEDAGYTIEVFANGTSIGTEGGSVDCFKPGASFAPFCAVAGSGVEVDLTDDGQLPSTFEVLVTVDGVTTTHGPYLEPGVQRFGLPEGTEYEIEVTSAGRSVSIERRAVDCYQPGATFDLVCARAGSYLAVTLIDGGLPSTFEVVLTEEGGATAVEPGLTKAGIYQVPVEEGRRYTIEAMSGGASVASQSFDVNCADLTGFNYARSCDGYAITLANGATADTPGSSAVSYTVEVTTDGATTTRVLDIAPGEVEQVITGSIPEGAQARVEVTEASEGQVRVDEWTQNCGGQAAPATTAPPAPEVATEVGGLDAPVEVAGIAVEADDEADVEADDEVADAPPAGSQRLPRTGGNPLNFGVAASAVAILGAILVVLEKRRLGPQPKD
ncbi:MAG: hypothetical protein JJE52_11705 [Acidimicrobiia bacterium]|nr:hypothetical protein [Acidimicrobiia bacterium]